ncbi:hypothetical protein CISIN_1g042320mg [Citrus sinensis]|uniref:Uncharacterized protein n=1 Tax=Citrus sinensis TaxID=2711 RepID=A0A067G3N2_CITSI|nr:hypothetical protein CISIN_1g042320mg [Citrus sinensis]
MNNFSRCKPKTFFLQCCIKPQRRQKYQMKIHFDFDNNSNQVQARLPNEARNKFWWITVILRFYCRFSTLPRSFLTSKANLLASNFLP